MSARWLPSSPTRSYTFDCITCSAHRHDRGTNVSVEMNSMRMESKLGSKRPSRVLSPSSSLSEKEEQTEPKRMAFDSLGAFTSVCGLILVNFAFNYAPVTSWSTSSVLSTLVLGMACLIAFVYIEKHVAPEPLIPELKTKACLALACISAGYRGEWTRHARLPLRS